MNENVQQPGDIWSVFEELAHLEENNLFKGSKVLGSKPSREDCLRRALRPHDDAGFVSADRDLMALRERLDKALEELTFREIRRELGLLDSANDPLAYELKAHLVDLFDSNAFLRYVNAYLYFGVRFLPSTEEFEIPKKEWEQEKQKRRQGQKKLEQQRNQQYPTDKSDQSHAYEPPPCTAENRDENYLQFALDSPPPIEKFPNAANYYKDFRQRWESDQKSEDIKTALQFLDDYHVISDRPELYELEEPTAFELWLLGLRPEIDVAIENEAQRKRFEQIRKGLRDWAIGRSDFYLKLNPPKDQPTPVKTEGPAQGSRSLLQDRQVSNPIAGRLALNDLYWIARLLRADVGPSGWVQYHKHNWLQLLRFNSVLRNEPKEETEKLLRAEETLRSVFDFVLDLVQNALEVTASTDPDQGVPETTWRWRQVFDEELDEINKQRRIRRFRDPSMISQSGEEARQNAESSGTQLDTNTGDSSDSDNRDSSGREAQNKSDKFCAKYWSKKISGAEYPRNLIGLCFSGGGIRSATVNLGILQGLQELDLLRHFDYVSTVSGGGFIGSWLVGNVRRSQYWLGRKTDWNDSIRHLRAYSSYLSPRTGVLSADTWNLINSWIRNTFLIQITGVAWLFAVLMAAILGLRLFVHAGSAFAGGCSASAWVAYCAAFIVATASLYYLGNLAGRATNHPGPISSWVETIAGLVKRPASNMRLWLRQYVNKHPEALGWLDSLLCIAESLQVKLGGGGRVLPTAVLPGWLGACALCSCFWFHAPLHSQAWIALDGVSSYSEILAAAWRPWLLILIPAAAGFFLFAWNTLRWRKFQISPLVVLICTGVLYLELVAIFYLFRSWSALGDRGNSLAYVFGPAMVLVAFTVCILLLIGLTGRNSNEAQREWWTRFGTWLGIFTGVGLFITGVAIFGPWMVLNFFRDAGPSSSWTHKIKWTAVLGWFGTVIGGLLAGNSSKTTGAGNSQKLEILAKAGGLLFILGSFFFGSTLLYILLFEIFGPDYAVSRSHALHIFFELNIWNLAEAGIVVFAAGIVFSNFFEINIFGFSQFYRNRLVRCYLGATRWMRGNRRPNEFTKFDFRDDLGLWRFRTDSPGEGILRQGSRLRTQPESIRDCSPYRGPFPIINCSLNLGGSSDPALNTRRGASFTLTSLRCGSGESRVGYAPTIVEDSEGSKQFRGGFANGVQLGQAVAISGAAVSANMGYNTSPLVAFLLTMFNVRLGWWFPNPGRRKWQKRGLGSSLKPLCAELFGVADDRSDYINVSDGGHFENLAIYELIRRRCKLIVACDAEADLEMQFGGLGKMIRLCQTDFGAVIDLDVKSIRPQENGYSRSHCAVGVIKYCTGEIGYLMYLKASMTGDEDVSITQYRSTHPTFPHESTADQFYSEDQFESYRMLGLHMVRKSFQGIVPGDDLFLIAETIFDLLAPAGPPSEKFLAHAKALIEMWEKFRASIELLGFMKELVTLAKPNAENANPAPSDPGRGYNDAELCIGLELIQLMENVFLDLRLDDFWDHPDNRGWAILFMRWARSPKFRKIWNDTRRTFGIRFEHFCSTRLGLQRDNPIVRL